MNKTLFAVMIYTTTPLKTPEEIKELEDTLALIIGPHYGCSIMHVKVPTQPMPGPGNA